MAWANVLGASMFCPLALMALLYLRPQAEHLANLTAAAATHLEDTSDASQLRERLVTQWNSDSSVWHSLYHVWGGLALLFAAVIFLFLLNAVYQFKAYRLLKSESSSPNSLKASP